MTVTQRAPMVPSPTAQVFGMWQASVVTQMLRVAGDHDIFARLQDGPRTSDDLAAATGTHAPSLHRLLRAVAGLGLLHARSQGWELTPLGTAAAQLGRMPSWTDDTIAALGRTVATGTPAMTFAHGTSVFGYFEQHPDEGAEFDRIMSLINAGEPEAVVDAYDFAGVERLVDVGGGNGAFLAEVLRSQPSLQGVLFDLPRTVARAIPELAAFSDRVATVGGDFFESVPAGADGYLLSHVVHDWPEPQALAVLARVRAAIAPTGRLVIVEMVMPADDTPHPVRMLDVTMMMFTGGMERTEEEYAELLARAGFRLERVVPTRSPVSVLEAVPV